MLMLCSNIEVSQSWICQEDDNASLVLLTLLVRARIYIFVDMVAPVCSTEHSGSAFICNTFVT